jgi:hypothetical protein
MTSVPGRSLAVTVAMVGAFYGQAASASVRGPFTVEPVRALAAHETAVAAIVSTASGPQVLLLARDEVGGPMAVVRRWPEHGRGGSPDDHRAQMQRSRSDVDDTLWLYDLGDADRDSWLIDDLLELEGLDDERGAGRHRPERRHDPEPIPRAVAAAASEMWLATSRGLWRLEGQGAAARWHTRGLDGHDVSQVTVARDDTGRVVVMAISGGIDWRSTDLGKTWQPGDLDESPQEQGSVEARSLLPEHLFPADVTTTATATGEIWIGTAHGLYAANVEDDVDAWQAAGLLRDTVTDELLALGALERATDPRPLWFRHVPRIVVEVGTRIRAGRTEVRGLILLTIPLGRALP